MSEKKRGNFSEEQVRNRLSRRRFTMATTGAVMMAMGTRNVWGQDEECPKCDATTSVFKPYSVRQIFAEPNDGGLSLCTLVANITDEVPEDARPALRKLQSRLFDCDSATDSRKAIHYRDFFVTEVEIDAGDGSDDIFNKVVNELVPNSGRRERLKTAVRNADPHFQLPMLKLDRHHNHLVSERVIDGWEVEGTGHRTAGLVETFQYKIENEHISEKLYNILMVPPVYSREDSPPWQWRAHLLRHANAIGMTSVRNTSFDYAKFYMEKRNWGANQCAYYTGAGWECQYSQGDKCTLQGTPPEPTEGTDMCAPPPE